MLGIADPEELPRLQLPREKGPGSVRRRVVVAEVVGDSPGGHDERSWV
jgi:hypothetical protein